MPFDTAPRAPAAAPPDPVPGPHSDPRFEPHSDPRADEIRVTVRAAIAAIAPEADLALLRDDAPLRPQLDLDSIDWVNVATELQARLGIAVPDSELARLASVDAIVRWAAAQPLAAPPPAPYAPIAGRTSLPHLERVFDGRPVTIRPVVPADLPLQAEFFRRLSPEARYSKFMVEMREVPAAKLRQLSAVDQDRHVALLALAESDGLATAVGFAHYVADPARGDCEFAIAVDDAFQRSGLAGLLMQMLIDVARARGLATMFGLILATNRQMLRFARQLGFTLAHEPDDYATVRATRAL